MKNDPFPFQSYQKKDAPDRRRKHGFISPRKVEDRWNFYRKGMYVERRRHGLPGWLLPLLALLLIVVMVFWGVPTIISRLQAVINADQGQTDNQVNLLYGEDTWTVSKPVADVFDSDDLKAGRVTQALYNEPVRILSRDCAFGFAQVRLQDGTEGFMFLKDLADSRESIEPDLSSYRLVVAANTKRIMSHASSGTLLVEVVMGTVLFADYRGDGISRVRLPDGSEGWISDDGVIVLPPLGQIEPVAEGARYFCSTALAFNKVTVLQNGQSIYGVSTTGIARLAAAINGVTLPRSLAGQALSGQGISLSLDEETGLADLEQILPGDLVFLSAAAGNNEGQPESLAICVDRNQVLYARPGQTSIKLIDLTQNIDLWQRIITVRRLFPR